MKPDWKDAPEWAKYLCMDQTGDWFWFELEPEWNYYLLAWMQREGAGKWKLAGNNNPEPSSTLEPRP